MASIFPSRPAAPSHRRRVRLRQVRPLAVHHAPRPPAGRIAAGRILFAGRDLATLPPAEMRALRGRRIAMIFQEPMTSLNPAFTIGDQIIEAMRAHDRSASAQALRARPSPRSIESASPPPPAGFDEYPHQMSGGMRQRVMIAMALSCEPDLLIADEPTTALDVTVQAQILDLLRTLQQQTGMAIILITHDLGVVAEMADEVAVMYAGRVVERSPGPDIFDDPQHPYTLGLLGSIPKIEEDRDRLLAIEGAVHPRSTCQLAAASTRAASSPSRNAPRPTRRCGRSRPAIVPPACWHPWKTSRKTSPPSIRVFISPRNPVHDAVRKRFPPVMSPSSVSAAAPTIRRLRDAQPRRFGHLYPRDRPRGGGVPVLIPANGPTADIETLLDRLDGIILTGSRSNVHPTFYDGPPHAEGTHEDPNRDGITLPLIRAAVARGVPLLAICRGFQELNVALGGSLHQRLQDLPDRIDHSTPMQPSAKVRQGKSHGIRSSREDGCTSWPARRKPR